MTNSKKATATKTASKKAIVKPTVKSTAKKAPVTPPVDSSVKVALATTTYHYFRNWVKAILKDGEIKASFVKEETGYNGKIMVAGKDLVKAKNVLDSYTKKNPDIVAMWTF